MQLQNRVSPFGEIVTDPARGLFMGNRGILHNDKRELGTSRWKHPHWVTCVLTFKGRKRELMGSGSYTELFFLDEPTALAAGHRPCAECRRADYDRFVLAWMRGHDAAERPSAGAIDAELHRWRVDRSRRQVRFPAEVRTPPDGAMFEQDGAAWLVWNGAAHRWSFGGYTERRQITEGLVTVLTPEPTIRALRAGYRPTVHSSAEG